IEKLKNFELLHGECVALGLIPMCGEAIRPRVLKALSNVGLPTEYAYDKDAVFAALSHDKKTQGEKVTIVKSDEIGSFYFENVSIEELKKYL
ncbi:MAG: 3-dehydroquinate synthase, partial [Acutalibacteraceae bacterium]